MLKTEFTGGKSWFEDLLEV